MIWTCPMCRNNDNVVKRDRLVWTICDALFAENQRREAAGEKKIKAGPKCTFGFTYDESRQIAWGSTKFCGECKAA